MEQTIAKILFHSGFEGISLSRLELIFDLQPFAFDVITGVAIEYLQDIGRTLTMYMNNNDSRKKYTEEVRHLVLSLTLGITFACSGFERCSRPGKIRYLYQRRH
jgi:hypothetical protein